MRVLSRDEIKSTNGDLPSGWVWGEIGNFCNLINGRAFKPTEWTSKGLPIVRIQNLNNEDAEFNYCDFQVDDKYIINRGQLLFAWSGTPGTSFGAHIWKKGKAVLNQHIFRVEINESNVDKIYLMYLLNRNIDEYIRKAHGTAGLAHITKGKFENSIIPIAPLTVQKLIVSEIEKQFSRLDEAVAALKRIKANLKRYKAAVLKAAVEGKLTEEWRLLQIARSRLKNKKINDTADLPDGWRCAKLAEVAEINPKLPKNIPDNVEVSFLPMKAVQEEIGVIDLSITKKFGEVKKGYTSFINNDIIFAKITPCMENGKIAIVENLKNGLGFGSTEFHVIRLHEPKSKKYLFYFLLQRDIRKQAQRNMTGTAGQLRVPAKFMQEISVSLPPISEQQKIVEEIESRLSVAGEIEAAVETNLKRAERLRQAILKKAFSGKLINADQNGNKMRVRTTFQRSIQRGAK